MKRLIFLLVLLMFVFGCAKQNLQKGDLWLNTEDGVKLKATMLDAEGDKAVILLHMLGHDRNDWDYFAKKLNDDGFTVLSVDIRGNGESEGDWRKFSDADFNKMTYDVKAAKKLLDSKGKKYVSLIGASIGANIAFKYAAADKDIKSVVLLSPGINYKGIDISSDIENFDRPVLIVVSSEDTYPYDSSNIIYEKIKGEKSLILEANLGHGTDMLPKSEELQDKIIGFI